MGVDILGSADVAERLNCTPRQVQRAAKTHGIGRLISRSWVFTQADIPLLSEHIQDGPGWKAGRSRKDYAAETSPGKKPKK